MTGLEQAASVFEQTCRDVGMGTAQQKTQIVLQVGPIVVDLANDDYDLMLDHMAGALEMDRGTIDRLITALTDDGKMLDEIDYVMVQQKLMMFSSLVIDMRLSGFIATASHAEAVGPVMDPTLYREVGHNLRNIKALARALKYFQDEVRAQAFGERSGA